MFLKSQFETIYFFPMSLFVYFVTFELIKLIYFAFAENAASDGEPSPEPEVRDARELQGFARPGLPDGLPWEESGSV